MSLSLFALCIVGVCFLWGCTVGLFGNRLIRVGAERRSLPRTRRPF